MSDDHQSGRAPPKRPRPWPQEASPDATGGYASQARQHHRNRRHGPPRTQLRPPRRQLLLQAPISGAGLEQPRPQSHPKDLPDHQRGESMAARRERCAPQAHVAGTVVNNRASGMGGMARRGARGPGAHPLRRHLQAVRAARLRASDAAARAAGDRWLASYGHHPHRCSRPRRPLAR